MAGGTDTQDRCRMQNTLIPTMTSKERAGRGGSRPRRLHCRAMVRLEARRHARIMNRSWEWERRSLRGDPLFHSAHTACGLLEVRIVISMPRYLRPVSIAAAQELPLPAKGSNTNSPGNVKLRTSGTRARPAFCVGCSYCPIRHVQHITEWLLRQWRSTLRQKNACSCW